MEKPKLEFSSIDAKNYSVVVLNNFRASQPYCSNSKKNLRIAMEAEREYLERLAELQKAIKDEFEPQMEPEPEKRDFTEEEYWAIGEEMNKKPKRDKNIDNLWYS